MKVYIPYRSLVEALYTLNSPPVVSVKWGSFRRKRGPHVDAKQEGA